MRIFPLTPACVLFFVAIIVIFAEQTSFNKQGKMIEKYHETDPLTDVISDDYRMLQILGRFGITLGFGEKSVAEACEAQGVDVSTFLTVVNYVKDTAHARVDEMAEQVSLPDLMLYLKNSHSYFVDFRLPNIRRKLLESLNCSGNNRVSFLVLRFYDDYAAEVARHMSYEDSTVHPFVSSLLQGKRPSRTFAEVVQEQEDNHISIEKSISDLKNIIIKYYPSGNNATLMGEVLMDIFMTEEDLLVHCQMEDSLFAESVRRLEKSVREREEEGDSGDVAGEEALTKTSSVNELSEREKEIIVEIVKGLSNKEIAESLYISVNTVMTHRRNISRKLQIHSPAALTIYAIVNGLVSLDDVKL